jgi:hypothetical protein
MSRHNVQIVKLLHKHHCSNNNTINLDLPFYIWIIEYIKQLLTGVNNETRRTSKERHSVDRHTA